MTDKIEKRSLPTLEDLYSESPEIYKDNALMVILNQEPKASWLREHPMAKVKNKKGETVPLPYLPIERVEFLLTAIYTKWRVEILNVCTIANSVAVTVRLFVRNPINGEWEYQDGAGAAPIQTDAGAGAADWNKVKSAGVQMALPSAETYAIKDAAEKLGKLFGKDLGRRDTMEYATLLKTPLEIDYEDLCALFELKRDKLPPEEEIHAERIIKDKETKSYAKLHRELSKL